LEEILGECKLLLGRFEVGSVVCYKSSIIRCDKTIFTTKPCYHLLADNRVDITATSPRSEKCLSHLMNFFTCCILLCEIQNSLFVTVSTIMQVWVTTKFIYIYFDHNTFRQTLKHQIQNMMWASLPTIKKTTFRHSYQPISCYGINKVVRTKLQLKRPKISRPGPQLPHNTEEKSRQE
jgi:hypothetical protein